MNLAVRSVAVFPIISRPISLVLSDSLTGSLHFQTFEMIVFTL